MDVVLAPWGRRRWVNSESYFSAFPRSQVAKKTNLLLLLTKHPGCEGEKNHCKKRETSRNVNKCWSAICGWVKERRLTKRSKSGWGAERCLIEMAFWRAAGSINRKAVSRRMRMMWGGREEKSSVNDGMFCKSLLDANDVKHELTFVCDSLKCFRLF